MNRTVKNICISIILFVLALVVLINPVQAATSMSDKQELVNMLNQYKNDLGDLNQLKTVVDKMYSDLNSATTVDDTLKQTLKNDINMLDNVTGINPLILTVLKSELNSQVDELSNDNLSELKEELQTIKDWVDEQVGDNGNSGNTTGNTTNNTSGNTTGGTTNNNTIIDKSNSQVKNNTSTIKGNTTSIAGNQNKAFMLPSTGTGKTIGLVLVILAIVTVGSIVKYINLRDIK